MYFNVIKQMDILRFSKLNQQLNKTQKKKKNYYCTFVGVVCIGHNQVNWTCWF